MTAAEDTAIDGMSRVELALNLNRMYRAVQAYPTISGVASAREATRDEVIEGYKRVRSNRHLQMMCLDGEVRIRREHRMAIAFLEGATDAR